MPRPARRRAAALALALACAVLASGCLAQAQPARSVPLQTIAPQPPPITAADAVTIVGYELSAIYLSTRFAGEWDERAEDALVEMGFEPRGPAPLVFARENEAEAHVAPATDGFWLNLTYALDDVFAPTLAEASARAEDEWRELEPHSLGTLAHFSERTGATPQGEPTRAHAYHARLVGWDP